MIRTLQDVRNAVEKSMAEWDKKGGYKAFNATTEKVAKEKKALVESRSKHTCIGRTKTDWVEPMTIILASWPPSFEINCFCKHCGKPVSEKQ